MLSLINEYMRVTETFPYNRRLLRQNINKLRRTSVGRVFKRTRFSLPAATASVEETTDPLFVLRLCIQRDTSVTCRVTWPQLKYGKLLVTQLPDSYMQLLSQ